MILVVDDEPAVAMLIASALKQRGFPVVTARSGADAIAISRSHRGAIQLVITDVRMAGIDGPTLVRLLAAEQPDLAAIFISGSGDFDSRPSERYEFLAKPFSIETLLADVGTMLTPSSQVS